MIKISNNQQLYHYKIAKILKHNNKIMVVNYKVIPINNKIIVQFLSKITNNILAIINNIGTKFLYKTIKIIIKFQFKTNRITYKLFNHRINIITYKIISRSNNMESNILYINNLTLIIFKND